MHVIDWSDWYNNCTKSIQRAVLYYMVKILCSIKTMRNRYLRPLQLVKSYIQPSHWVWLKEPDRRAVWSQKQNYPMACHNKRNSRCLVFLLNEYIQHMKYAFEGILYIFTSKTKNPETVRYAIKSNWNLNNHKAQSNQTADNYVDT